MHWLITDKGDADCRRLVDGDFDGGREPHYSRQTVGALQFTRNGQNLVFITADLRAVWVTFRPTPGKAVRPDGLDCWENTLFRNEGPILSSILIREAVELSHALWGEKPCDGFITYIQKNATRCPIIGYCYKRAGWRRCGFSKDGKLRFRAPQPLAVHNWKEWGWRDDRGGKLRETLTKINVRKGYRLFGMSNVGS